MLEVRREGRGLNTDLKMPEESTWQPIHSGSSGANQDQSQKAASRTNPVSVRHIFTSSFSAIIPPPPPVSLICIKSLMAFWSPKFQRIQTFHDAEMNLSCTDFQHRFHYFQSHHHSFLRVHVGKRDVCVAQAALLTNVVSTVTNVGRYFVNALAVQNGAFLSEGAGQLLVDGPGKQITALLNTHASPADFSMFAADAQTDLHLLKASMARFHSCSSNSTIPVRYAVYA